jgi:hypothetical protein
MSCCLVEILPPESEIIQLRKDFFQARYDANFYKSHYQNGIVIRERMRYEHDAEIRKLRQKYQAKIDELEKLAKDLQAKVKLRERQLFGKKSERGAAGSESVNKNRSTLLRGQQRGKKSPPKRDYTHLPIIHEVQEIPKDERLCPCCSMPYIDMGATEDSPDFGDIFLNRLKINDPIFYSGTTRSC